MVLRENTFVDRYGDPDGTFVSPVHIPFEERSLPNEFKETKNYYVYRVIKDIIVKEGTSAPWFGQPGGGIQYKFDRPIEDLVDDGILEEIRMEKPE